MQNKGAIRIFAIIFALVSLYHLSFTFVTSRVEKNANSYANSEQAWNLAEELAAAKSSKVPERIDQADRNVALLSNIIKNPPGKVLPLLLNIIGMMEEKNVGKIIRRLES